MDQAERFYRASLQSIPHQGIAGYFGPDSLSWRLYREPVVVLGGARALLLQVAHPAVAEGVARFSNFKKDALGRGFRTFLAMATLYFGDDRQAREVGLRLFRRHSGIKGTYQNDHGTAEAYRATDPGLQLWVLATLTDTTLRVFEYFPLKGLPPDWKARFYEESKTAAALLGIPSDVYPPDLPAFDLYFTAMLNGPLLGSTPTTRETAQAILQHRLAPGRLVHLLADGWLPPALCDRLGVRHHARSEKNLKRLLTWARFGIRLIPPKLRYAPAYHQAMHRVAENAGQPTTLLGRWYTWLGRHTRLPLGIQVSTPPPAP